MQKITGIFLLLAWLASLAGCTTFQQKIADYAKDKEQCLLNTENVTQFMYQSQNYSILEETVPNTDLGDWIGYIRELVIVDEAGKILLQEKIEKTTRKSLEDLADKTADAAYILPFLNVYEASDDTSYLIVDVNGGYYKAVPTEGLTEEAVLFNYKKVAQEKNSGFEVSRDNATQIICNGVTYQVTEKLVSEEELGGYLAIIAENITFDADTKKPLDNEEMKKMDWLGEENTERENWIYEDVCEMIGRDISEAVAVKVNDRYYVAIAE